MAVRADMHLAAAAATLAMLFGHVPLQATASPLMRMFDTNRDGCVSLAEYQAYMDKGFHRLDANGNGVLEAAELPPGSRRRAPLTLARRHREVARQFHRQDIDHDACLRLEELMAPPR